MYIIWKRVWSIHKLSPKESHPTLPAILSGRKACRQMRSYRLELRRWFAGDQDLLALGCQMLISKVTCIYMDSIKRLNSLKDLRRCWERGARIKEVLLVEIMLDRLCWMMARKGAQHLNYQLFIKTINYRNSKFNCFIREDFFRSRIIHLLNCKFVRIIILFIRDYNSYLSL